LKKNSAAHAHHCRCCARLCDPTQEVCRTRHQNAGATALDYDMLIMLALSAFDAASGSDRYLQQRIRVH
jgi:superfamily I DNA/RNA helicase